jgi:hypothetical protein
MLFRRLYDIADYDIGYEFNICPHWRSLLFRIVRIKISKIDEFERYVTLITIFGTEWIKE